MAGFCLKNELRVSRLASHHDAAACGVPKYSASTNSVAAGFGEPPGFSMEVSHVSKAAARA